MNADGGLIRVHPCSSAVFPGKNPGRLLAGYLCQNMLKTDIRFSDRKSDILTFIDQAKNSCLKIISKFTQPGKI